MIPTCGEAVAVTGKYGTGRDPGDGRYADVSDKPWLARRINPAAVERIDEYLALCASRDLLPSQVALAWVTAQPGVTSSIIGPRTFEQWEDNLGALSLKLDEKLAVELDRIFPPGGAHSFFYEADFGPHDFPPLM